MFSRDPLANPEPLIKRVYAYAAYRVGDGPDAEDITSETFERALRYRDSFDPRKGDPVGWLVGIARRCVDDLYARRQILLAEAHDAAAPGDLESETVERVELAAALERMGERDRELIALRFGADLTGGRKRPPRCGRRIGLLGGLDCSSAVGVRAGADSGWSVCLVQSGRNGLTGYVTRGWIAFPDGNSCAGLERRLVAHPVFVARPFLACGWIRCRPAPRRSRAEGFQN
jgi:RNA polymerase sigma factor (sigma-70 family)